MATQMKRRAFAWRRRTRGQEDQEQLEPLLRGAVEPGLGCSALSFTRATTSKEPRLGVWYWRCCSVQLAPPAIAWPRPGLVTTSRSRPCPPLPLPRLPSG
ncbi:Hypothetical protein NTJ_05106 [Nesidiocoris tenuis]|nr:Hypothetical protein NTJ_05106 [Nesidiocoris tenuis]